uniref:FAM194 C-terminal domain-containing protein n=1 Tax=Chelydra serpentina TaxID=8475 RepID=A0A8C3RNB7_CHESE
MSTKRSEAKLYEKFKVAAPEMLAQIIRLLALCHKQDIHVPQGVKNLFEFTWEELTVMTERKAITGEYCPVVNLLPTMQSSFSSTTYKSHLGRKSIPKGTMSEPSYVSPSAENQQILLKFQRRSVHLLSELLKLKMKVMIDSVTGKDTSGVNVISAPPSLCTDSQGKGNTRDCLGDWLLLVFVSTFTFAGSPKVKPMQEAINQHDPCPEARQKLREMCRHMTKWWDRNIEKSMPDQIYGQPCSISFCISYPTGNIAACQFPMCCVGKTITLLFNNAPSLALLASFIADYQACVRYSFKASCSLALMMDLEGGAVRDRDGYLTHKWSWASKTQILQSLEFQINEQLKLKVLGQNSITLSFSSLNETINMSLSRAPCAHTPKAEKWNHRISGEEKEQQLERALEEIKKRFQKTVKQFINAILIASGIVFFAECQQSDYVTRRKPPLPPLLVRKHAVTPGMVLVSLEVLPLGRTLNLWLSDSVRTLCLYDVWYSWVTTLYIVLWGHAMNFSPNLKKAESNASKRNSKPPCTCSSSVHLVFFHYHRISGLEGTLRGHLVQPPAQSRTNPQFLPQIPKWPPQGLNSQPWV